MKLIMFAVFDAKMNTYSSPFFDAREGSALRNFSDWVNDGSNPNNMLFKHPEDFSLFRIGEFDPETGHFDSHNPVNLVTASAVKAIAAQPALVN